MASHFYKRIKKAGTPEEMQLILWRTIMALQAAAADATTPEELCKVANSLTPACREYWKIFQDTEALEMLKKVQDQLDSLSTR